MVPSLSILGDSAVRIIWPGLPDDLVFDAIRRALSDLNDAGFAPGQLVPGFASLTVMFDDGLVNWNEQLQRIENILRNSSSTYSNDRGRCVRIPVCFAPEFAPDLPLLLERTGLSETECIDQLTRVTFQVRMIGFAPGFPYLAGLPAHMALPRRATPRLQVPAGAVAIGGNQAGVYPQTSPGGWNLVGRTPVRLFDPLLPNPCLLNPADSVQFFAITKDACDSWLFDA
jgi:KipI family sensor histidine kinase inhibitor